MTFVNASLLAGTLLVALPIILHLIMRRKPQLFEFPALRFVQKRHDQNQRRLKLRHILLLLLRAAAIALLAFALARPSVQFGGSLGSQEAPVSAALVFDTAPRMQYRQDNQTRLEAAKKTALWLMAQLPPESQIAVIDTGTGAAAFQADRGAAQQRISQLETAPNSQSLTAACTEAMRLLAEKSTLPQKELYVFTDMARGAWPSEGAARLRDLRTELPAVGVYPYDVGVLQPTNFALDDVQLPAQVLSNRSTLVVGSELSRTAPSGSPPEDRTVELYLLDADRRPQNAGQQSCTLDADASQHVEFRVGNLEVGTHQGYLRIVGQDNLTEDDTRCFTVQVKPAWRILLAAPAPAAQYAHFLRAALAPESFRKRGQARFDCDVADVAQISARDLESYAAVCLLDPPALDGAVWRKLADYTAEGHGLAIFLGRNARPVDAFNSAEPQALLPGTLLRQARRLEGDCYFAPRDYQHPVLAAFRSVAGSVPWSAFPVFRYWEFEPATGVGAVITLNDQNPVLFERPVGAGRVLTLATPISDRADAKAWNLLPVGVIDNPAPFVMLANQMLLYLVGSTDEQLNYYAGQTAVLPIDPKNQRREYVLFAPRELTMPLSSDPKQQRLAITATEQPGNYRVRSGDTSEGLDLGFSVNLAPPQTDLERTDPQQLQEIFLPFPIHAPARTREQFDRSVSAGRVGRELFSPLILVLAVILAAEHLVANRFYKE